MQATPHFSLIYQLGHYHTKMESK